MRTVQVDKVLVVLLSEMGSLVLAIPMFRRLREKYPDKPLYAVIVDIGASGGYYIAAAADGLPSSSWEFGKIHYIYTLIK